MHPLLRAGVAGAVSRSPFGLSETTPPGVWPVVLMRSRSVAPWSAGSANRKPAARFTAPVPPIWMLPPRTTSESCEVARKSKFPDLNRKCVLPLGAVPTGELQLNWMSAFPVVLGLGTRAPRGERILPWPCTEMRLPAFSAGTPSPPAGPPVGDPPSPVVLLGIGCTPPGSDWAPALAVHTRHAADRVYAMSFLMFHSAFAVIGALRPLLP